MRIHCIFADSTVVLSTRSIQQWHAEWLVYGDNMRVLQPTIFEFSDYFSPYAFGLISSFWRPAFTVFRRRATARLVDAEFLAKPQGMGRFGGRDCSSKSDFCSSMTSYLPECTFNRFVLFMGDPLRLCGVVAGEGRSPPRSLLESVNARIYKSAQSSSQAYFRNAMPAHGCPWPATWSLDWTAK